MSAAQVCINPHYGLIIEGGVTGNVLWWETSTILQQRLYLWRGGELLWVGKSSISNRIQCFSSAQEPSATGRCSLSEIAASAWTIPHLGTPTNAGVCIIITEGDKKRDIKPRTTTDLTKRVASVPFISGLFNCLNVDDQIRQDNTDNDIYSDGRSNSLN